MRNDMSALPATPDVWYGRSFQREGVRFALRHNGRALIADDMGTGKTVQVPSSLHITVFIIWH